MIFDRHSFIAFIVLAAIVSVFFSPILPATGITGRHHARANFAVVNLPAHNHSILASLVSASATPQARAIHSEILLALNCARLC